MFVELPKDLILAAVAAFLLGWILSSISSRLGSRHRATKRDPRDDRIRSLEAELRIAQADTGKTKTALESLEDQLKETTAGLETRDLVITEQQSKIDKITRDLKDSVLKTRELRAELADRAAQSVHAEAKIREVETELSVAQASTDLIATGVLDYRFEEDDEEGNVSKTAS
jgi:chromosome segregation ATPase